MLNHPINTSLPCVLVIDDAADIRMVINRILRDEFTVIEASNGKEGWSKIQQYKNIQLIVTDLDMPEMNGFDVIKQVRLCNDEGIHNLPIIMLTSNEENESSKKQALQLGATEFHTKPITALHLLASVRAHTNYHQTNKTLRDRINIDPLTGLLNKKGFEDQLEKDISMAARHEQELSVFTVHLNLSNDTLKPLNNVESNKIIQHIADILVKAVRKEDTVSRDSITTFMMSLPTAKPDGAIELAQRIFLAVEKNNIVFQEQTHHLNLAIGICSIETGYVPSKNEVIQESQKAMADAIKIKDSKISMRTLHKPYPTPENEKISIDKLLSQLEKDAAIDIGNDMELVLKRLAPIFKRLTDEQKISLLNSSHQTALIKKMDDNH